MPAIKEDDAQSPSFLHSCMSPVHHLVYDLPLLRGRPAQVYPGGLYALVAHEVRQKSYVAEPLQEVLREAVPERMGVDHLRIQTVPAGQGLQLHRHAARSETSAVTVQEKIPAVAALALQPCQGLPDEPAGDVYPPRLASLGIDVEIAGTDMLHLELHELSHARPGGRHEPHHEIPVGVAVLPEAGLEEPVVGVTDHVLKEVLLLDLHETQLEPVLPDELQVAVDSLKPQVDRLRPVMLNEIPLVGEQVVKGEGAVAPDEMGDSPHVRLHGVLRQT